MLRREHGRCVRLVLVRRVNWLFVAFFTCAIVDHYQRGAWAALFVFTSLAAALLLAPKVLIPRLPRQWQLRVLAIVLTGFVLLCTWSLWEDAFSMPLILLLWALLSWLIIVMEEYRPSGTQA